MRNVVTFILAYTLTGATAFAAASPKGESFASHLAGVLVLLTLIPLVLAVGIAIRHVFQSFRS